VLAKFSEWGYFYGPNKAKHLNDSEANRQYAKKIRRKLINFVCWYEFGHTDPMNPNTIKLYSKALDQAGSGKHGHTIGLSYQDKKMDLFHEIWSDRPNFVMCV
jgi:hypothetical protein